MPEMLFVLGAVLAGALCSSAVLIAPPARPIKGAGPPVGRPLQPSTYPRQPTWLTVRTIAALRDWLAVNIDRAGWRESPERIAVLSLILAVTASALALSSAALVPAPTAAVLAVAGAAGGIGTVMIAITSAIARRRNRLSRELAPLLELFILELSGGGSALSALGSVTMQLDGELAAELRRLLIASQVSGSATYEVRLHEYAERLQIPAIASLATIIAASREYGTGVAQGARALAADLRRAQRRDLIAHSRRALNHVLFPAAIGVLLPFLAILLYPAVSTLQRSLR
jgi:Flp pilus assembly protein TadB